MGGVEALIPLVAIIATFGIPGIIIFWAIYTKHRERMRLIEKGLPPEEVKAYFANETKQSNPFAALKWGILLTFIGLGIFLGNLFEEMYDVGEGIIFGVVVFSAGLGFLIYFAIANAKTKDKGLQQV
jgi:hypothetical protein